MCYSINLEIRLHTDVFNNKLVCKRMNKWIEIKNFSLREIVLFLFVPLSNRNRSLRIGDMTTKNFIIKYKKKEK